MSQVSRPQCSCLAAPHLPQRRHARHVERALAIGGCPARRSLSREALRIIYSIKVWGVPKLPKREINSMTIGVGFRCMDGVVLCSDRQITSSAGHKYEERKILSHWTPEYRIVLSYAGFPDAARMMFRKLTDEARERLPTEKGRFEHDKFRTILEIVFVDKQTKDLETLIAYK